MKKYLKKHNVTIHTIGPVFIGSGKEISKKEYILDNEKIHVIDQFKLYNYIKKIGKIKRFDDFLARNWQSDLKSWLENNNVSLDSIKDCYKYEIKHSDTALSRGTNITVMEFMRDAYGMPYVPGSSIKGMLRNIIIAYELLKAPNDYIDNRNDYNRAINKGGKRNFLLKNQQAMLEAKILNTLERKEERIGDAVNDCFAGIRVSDAIPQCNEDMVLCQRLEYHIDGTQKNLNVLRECIKPGVDINFSITIDEQLCKYSVEDIEHAISIFSRMYDEVFKLKFHNIPASTDNTVYLGGGVGFITKTDIYPLFGKDALEKTVEIFDKTNVSRQHGHYKDKKLGVSPHVLKATKYHGKIYHMGECTWKFD